MTFTNDAKTVGDDPRHDDDVARDLRELHDAARPASSDRRQSLRADAAERARAARSDWTAIYYHQASADGIGFDRTMQGNKAVDQYFPPVRDMFDNLATCPEEFLLWFHRCAWDYKLKSGKTLWDGLCEKYHEGADAGSGAADHVAVARRAIDPQRHKEVADRLAIQVADAAKWRDQILQYFQTFNKLPINKPAGS